MAARLSAKRLPRYGLEFKRKAVKLTEIPGMEVQVVAKPDVLIAVVQGDPETGRSRES